MDSKSGNETAGAAGPEDVLGRKASAERQDGSAVGARVLTGLAEQGALVGYRMSLPEGRYEYMSPGIVSLTGHTPEEFYARPMLMRELAHADSRQYLEESWPHLLAGRAPSFYEYAVVDRDGRIRWLRQQNVLLYDDEGRPRAIEGAVYEITQYKRAESSLEQLIEQRTVDVEWLYGRLNSEVGAHHRALSQLRSREAQLQLLTDHLAAAVSYVDEHERYRFNNRKYEEWFGRTHEQTYGKTLREVLGDAAYEVIRDKVRAALAGEAVTFEAPVPYARGGTRHVRAHYVPYRDEWGRVRGFYALISDISDSKRIEVAERRHMQELAHAARLASLGELAAKLSHDLAQPLSVISNYARKCSILLARGEIGRAQDVAAKLETQTKLAVDIVRGLRRFPQIRAPEKRRADLREPVRDALNMVQWDAEARRIPIRTVMPETLPAVEIDRGLIEQVVLNLLRNAIDAVSGTAPGEEAITVMLSTGGNAVEVSVSDYGPGLAPERREQLFEPFLTTKPDGAGVDLVICRRIVESHGGRLWAEDNPDGPGARFRFALPVAGASILE